MPRGNQFTRQWRLLQLLDRPAGVSVTAAAEDLSCTVRTIWRDLRVLEDAGLPIYDEPAADGRRGLWKVDEAFRKRLPLKLTLSQLTALLMSQELLAPPGNGILGPAVTSAFEKISGILSKDALALIAEMRKTIGVRAFGAKLQAPAAEHLPILQEASARRRTVRISYYSYHRDEETERLVDSYHVTYFNGGLYLVGYCHLRQAMRVFAVERIRRVGALARQFEIPRGFDVQQYLDSAWGMIQGDLVTVRVIFARDLARYIRERMWHPSQRFRDLPDGRLELTLRVADPLEVRRWILGYGVQAEVVEPPAMRESLQREAAQLAQQLAGRRKPLARVGRRPRRKSAASAGG